MHLEIIMTANDLNEKLITTFPELKPIFSEYIQQDGDGMDTGAFLTHEDIFHPFIKKALNENNVQKLAQIATYIEDLLNTPDEYAQNVATVALIEWLAFEESKKHNETWLLPKGRQIYLDFLKENRDL